MEQRRLRLGDTLDDYCPRERRVTNHVIVAMIEDEVKQTRCSTCDADHEYKQARVPAPRRKKEGGALQGEAAPDVLRVRRPDLVEEPELPSDIEVAVDAQEAVDVLPDAAPDATPAIDFEPPSAADRDDDGPVHRRLIRATLPRPEGQVPERKEPDFTVRQPGGRGREIDGNRPQQGHKRHRRPQRNGGGGERSGDIRFGSPNGHRGGGQGNRSGQSHQGHSGGQQPGNQGSGGRPAGGEGRFRRRRGR